MYLTVFVFFHLIINVGLAGKNFTKAGCSSIGSMSGIQGRWLYNSGCLFFPPGNWLVDLFTWSNCVVLNV